VSTSQDLRDIKERQAEGGNEGSATHDQMRELQEAGEL